MATELEKVINENPTAKEIFKNLANRRRYRKRTDLRKLRRDLHKANKKVNPDDFYNVFNKLQGLGMGSIVKGREGEPDRFAWNYSLKDIARSAMGEEKELKPISQETPSKPVKEKQRFLSGILNEPDGTVLAFKINEEDEAFVVQMLRKFGAVKEVGV